MQFATFLQGQLQQGLEVLIHLGRHPCARETLFRWGFRLTLPFASSRSKIWRVPAIVSAGAASLRERETVEMDFLQPWQIAIHFEVSRPGFCSEVTWVLSFSAWLMIRPLIPDRQAPNNNSCPQPRCQWYTQPQSAIFGSCAPSKRSTVLGAAANNMKQGNS